MIFYRLLYDFDKITEQDIITYGIGLNNQYPFLGNLNKAKKRNTYGILSKMKRVRRNRFLFLHLKQRIESNVLVFIIFTLHKLTMSKNTQNITSKPGNAYAGKVTVIIVTYNAAATLQKAWTVFTCKRTRMLSLLLLTETATMAQKIS